MTRKKDSIIICLITFIIMFVLITLQKNTIKTGNAFTKEACHSSYGFYGFNLCKTRAIKTDLSKMDPIKDWKKAIQLIAKEEWKSNGNLQSVQTYRKLLVDSCALKDDLKDRKLEFDCINKTWRGNWIDCNTFPFVVRKPCLVYSFGINYSFEPDDAFAALGCEVFSFDPSMGNTTEHVRKSGVHFLPIGLSGKSEKITPRLDLYTKKDPKQKWETKTLQDIMIYLGHEGRRLDYLKMDIEHYEWDAIEAILEHKLTQNIKQLGLEFHIFPDTPKKDIVNYLTIYKHFKEAGFSRYAGRVFEYNLNERSRRMQSDAEFVNLKFDF